MDVLFINPGNAKGIYQDLAKDYSAIETPTWSLLLAQSCRSVGFSVSILDVNAERLSIEQSVERIKEINPRLVCFAVYGQNPNAGTVNMAGTVMLSRALKKTDFQAPIAVVGSHVQALPHETLQKEKDSIDIIFTNEGVYALWNLLALPDLKNKSALETIKGIGFMKDGEPFLTPVEKLVPQDKMDDHLPGYAWDLLPYKEKPLDLYRSHFGMQSMITTRGPHLPHYILLWVVLLSVIFV